MPLQGTFLNNTVAIDFAQNIIPLIFHADMKITINRQRVSGITFRTNILLN